MSFDETASGVYAIAATPFLPDGRVDAASVDRMTDFYLGCGVSGLTVLGIMGKRPSLIWPSRWRSRSRWSGAPACR